jgi:hypothetical protein
MTTRLLPALIAALIIVRLPSLVQPMGPDQGLYAYVGERILHGDLAYRDAFDQKPPGIHYVYAGLRALSSRDVVVPAADLAAAILCAALLWIVGARIASPAAGWLSAVLFLLLSDPSFARYGGVRVRAQCETFIAVLVAGAVASVLAGTGGGKSAGTRGTAGALGAGVLLGATFALKYNAGLYLVVVLFAMAVTRGTRVRDIALLALGGAIVPLVLLTVFWRGGALGDLYQSTIRYNLMYSGETYASRFDMVRYLATFPVRHALVDGLWFLGGLGCVMLLAAGFVRRAAWIPVVWVAAACVVIAINGARDLPQYFVQAAPALALAAGVAVTIVVPVFPRVLQWGIVLVLAVGVWRAGDDPFPKLARNVWHDTEYVFGRIDRRTHLARYGGLREIDKYSALDNLDLGTYLGAHTSARDTVLVFGFSPGAYVYADRRSASRFFWSRPVILGFDREDPRWGVNGLLADLERARPAFVVLQKHDWSPDVQDSAPFFLSDPRLSAWLHAEYHPVRIVDAFDAWERNGR